MNKSNLNAFTLIEMLIVMGIISVLAAVSLFALEGSRESARDARRRADLETIRSGLELYRSDCGEYPIPSRITPGSTLTGDGTAGCPAANVYIQSIPGDPVVGRNYAYLSVSPFRTYRICAGLESETGAITACSSANCGTGVTCSYTVTNP